MVNLQKQNISRFSESVKQWVWKKKKEKKDENVESSALNKDPSKQPQRQKWAGLSASFQNKENADEHIQNIKLWGQSGDAAKLN